MAQSCEDFLSDVASQAFWNIENTQVAFSNLLGHVVGVDNLVTVSYMQRIKECLSATAASVLEEQRKKLIDSLDTINNAVKEFRGQAVDLNKLLQNEMRRKSALEKKIADAVRLAAVAPIDQYLMEAKIKAKKAALRVEIEEGEAFVKWRNEQLQALLEKIEILELNNKLSVEEADRLLALHPTMLKRIADEEAAVHTINVQLEFYGNMLEEETKKKEILRSMKENYEALARTIVQLNEDKVKRLMESMHAKRNSVMLLQEEIDSYPRKIEASENLLRAIEFHIRRQVLEMERLVDRKNFAKEDVVVLKSGIATREVAIAEVQSTINEVRQKLMKSSCLGQKEKAIKAVEKKKKRLQTILSKTHTVNGENEALKETVDKMQITMSKSVVQVHADMTMVKEKLSLLENDMAGMDSLYHSLEEKTVDAVGMMKSDKAQLQATLSHLEGRLSEEEEMMESFQLQLREMRISLEKFQERKGAEQELVVAQMTEEEAAIEEAQKKLIQLKAEVRKTKDETEIKKGELKQFQDRSIKLQEEVKTVSSKIEVATVKAQIRDVELRAQYDDVNTELKIYNAKMEKLEKEMQQLQFDLDVTKRACKAADRKLEDTKLDVEAAEDLEKYLKTTCNALLQDLVTQGNRFDMYLRTRRKLLSEHKEDLKIGLMDNLDLALKYQKAHEIYIKVREEVMRGEQEMSITDKNIADWKEVILAKKVVEWNLRDQMQMEKVYFDDKKRFVQSRISHGNRILSHMKNNLRNIHKQLINLTSSDSMRRLTSRRGSC